MRNNSHASNGFDLLNSTIASNGLGQDILTKKDAFEAFAKTFFTLTDTYSPPQNIWFIVQYEGKAPEFYKGTYDGDPLSLKVILTQKEEKGKKETRKEVGGYHLAYEYIRELSEKPGTKGVTWIPSQVPFTPTSDRFKQTDVLQIEFDKGTQTEQESLLKAFIKDYPWKGLAVHHSGNKSYHTTIKLSHSINKHDWAYLMSLLMAIYDGYVDPKPCNNVVQQMRVPSFYRKDKEKEQALLYLSPETSLNPLGKEIKRKFPTFEELKNNLESIVTGLGKTLPKHTITNKCKVWESSSISSTSTIDYIKKYGEENCLELIRYVVTNLPTRVAGTNTYDSYRVALGASGNILGDKNKALELFSPLLPHGTGDWEQVNDSTTGAFGIPALKQAFYNLTGSDLLLPSVFQGTTKNSIDTEELKVSLLQYFEEFYNSNLTGTALTLELGSLAKLVGHRVQWVESTYTQWIQEAEYKEQLPDLKRTLDHLLQVQTKDIDLGHYIPSGLAVKLKNISSILGTTELGLLTCLLPIASSLINANTHLTLIKASDFKRHPIIWSGIVGGSGCAKSPTLKTLKKPLEEFQATAQEMWERSTQLYSEALDQWKATPTEEREEKPITPFDPQRFYVNDTTGEALVRLQARQQDRGFLLEFDELSALLKGANQYKGGKGRDIENLLQARDGTFPHTERVDSSVFALRSTYSIVGGIQPDILKQQMGDGSDPNGYWARFLMCCRPTKKAIFPENDYDSGLYPLLKGIYLNLIALPAYRAELSPDAKELYREWFEYCQEEKVKGEGTYKSKIFSKHTAFVGDIALILSLIDTAYIKGITATRLSLDEFKKMIDEAIEKAFKPIELERYVISRKHLEKAIELIKIYQNQFDLIYQDILEVTGDLTPELKKIYDFSLKKGEIKARDVKMASRVFKSYSMADIRKMFDDLTEMGYGHTTGEGSKKSFLATKTSTEQMNQHAIDLTHQGWSVLHLPTGEWYKIQYEYQKGKEVFAIAIHEDGHQKNQPLSDFQFLKDTKPSFS